MWGDDFYLDGLLKSTNILNYIVELALYVPEDGPHKPGKTPEECSEKHGEKHALGKLAGGL
jgi:hypothetical protein